MIEHLRPKESFKLTVAMQNGERQVSIQLSFGHTSSKGDVPLDSAMCKWQRQQWLFASSMFSYVSKIWRILGPNIGEFGSKTLETLDLKFPQ